MERENNQRQMLRILIALKTGGKLSRQKNKIWKIILLTNFLSISRMIIFNKIAPNKYLQNRKIFLNKYKPGGSNHKILNKMNKKFNFQMIKQMRPQ